ncbi:MAG: OPT/YSL family transporter [Myxococcales bacterium]|nr:OPT/YSL family transporter [Myxococcales bacterium]
MTESQTSATASSSASAAAPRGELTVPAIIAAVLVAAIMGASYPYMVLKLGFGPNVSVVAAFFGFIILNLISYRTYDRWQNNIVQTAGTSAAQTAFMCVLLGAFDMLREAKAIDVELSPFGSFLWLTTACSLGVLLAVPLRRHFIVDEKLPFVDGVAAGETLIVLDPPRGKDRDPELFKKAKQATWALVIGVVASGAFMAVRDEAQILKWVGDAWVPTWVIGSVVLAKMGVGYAYGFLSLGSGMLIGLRINVSMMLGGVLAWIVLPPLLVDHGIVPPNPTKTQVLLTWVMWPATGMLVAGGLAALALRWRLLIDTFKSLRNARIGSTEFPLKWVVAGICVLSVALCAVQYIMLDMPIWMTTAAIVLSVPLMLVGLRVLGETNWGPISALSNMMQGVFAAIAPGNIGANMVASGTAGTVAVSSEAIMQDYKCGEVLGSTPRSLTIAQLLAVPVGAAAVAWTYQALVGTYGITAQNYLMHPAKEMMEPGLSSPISVKWAGFAQILREGVGVLPSSALWALLGFSVLGIILTVLESRPKLKKWVPSPTGIGIGMLVPFAVIAAMFVGGVLGTVWEKTDKKSADTYMVPFASGLIAGEAMVAVLVPLLLSLGLGG